MEQELSYYEERAREALGSQRGGFILWHDEEVGRTVANVLGAETNDPAGESNLAAALRLLAEHVEAGTVEQGSVGRSGRRWLSTLTVTVLDEQGQVTPAWVDTVDLVLDPLQDYPLLDEDDYYERRYAVVNEELNDYYGAAGDLAHEALDRYTDYGAEENVGDHDITVEAIEALLRIENRALLPDEVTGLAYYVEQRARTLDIPLLAAAVRAAEEVDA